MIARRRRLETRDGAGWVCACTEPARATYTNSVILMFTANLCGPLKLSRVERLQAVDALRRFGLPIPFEKLQHNPVLQEIRHRETMLLHRLDLLLHVQIGGRRGADTTKRRRPAGRRRADGTGQHSRQRVGIQINRASAENLSDSY